MKTSINNMDKETMAEIMNKYNAWISGNMLIYFSPAQ
jgi:hypothetical protein